MAASFSESLQLISSENSVPLTNFTSHNAAPQTNSLTAITVNNSTSQSVCQRHVVLLATAIVNFTAPNRDVFQVQVLVDPGPEASFVSDSLVQSLRLKRYPSSISVTGVGDKDTIAKGVTNFFLL